MHYCLLKLLTSLKSKLTKNQMWIYEWFMFRSTCNAAKCNRRIVQFTLCTWNDMGNPARAFGAISFLTFVRLQLASYNPRHRSHISLLYHPSCMTASRSPRILRGTPVSIAPGWGIGKVKTVGSILSSFLRLGNHGGRIPPNQQRKRLIKGY